MKNKIIPLILTALMTISIMSTSVFADTTTKISFSDVSASTQDGAAIYKLAEKGIINGNPDGTFAPESFVTRAQLCKMVNNIWGFTEMATEGFSDVTKDKWYYSYVLIGKKAGYINGYDDGTFKGDNFVTREQASAII
ncbi:MAG: S-layer homology domain-containing protein [Clostridia bacterium]|nr:S-layer homology domain-containing protein [Clostridia bacterium]